MTSNQLVQGKNDELVQKYHSQIFEMVNSRLTETSKFYAPLISSISGFGSIIFLSLKDSNNAHYAILIPLAYYFSMLLISCGIFYLLAVSYTYRALQVVLARLESHLQLTTFSPKWNPCVAVIFRGKSSWCCKFLSELLRRWLEPEALDRPIPRFIFLLCKVGSLWIFPEILKAHLLMLLSTAAMLSYINIVLFEHKLLPVIKFTGALLAILIAFNLRYLYKVRAHCMLKSEWEPETGSG